MLSNLHTHTTFCDGNNTAEDIVQKALYKGFSSIGFSGHGYTAFDLSYCMKDIKGYIEKIRSLKKIADERGQTLAQMALSWVYSKEGVTSVLIGASKPEQILENLEMTKNTKFTCKSDTDHGEYKLKCTVSIQFVVTYCRAQCGLLNGRETQNGRDIYTYMYC